MSKQRSVGTYRAIDLALFAVMTVVFEFLIVKVSSGLFRQEFWVVSITCAVTCIVYMRWGAWGAIHAVLGGVVWCLANGTGDRTLPGWCFYIIYGAGNLLSLAVLPLMKKIGKEKIRKNKRVILLIAALTQLLMHAGRVITAFICGVPAAELLSFFTTDALSYVFTMLVVFAAAAADGVYEDQLHYLKRLQKEEALKGETV